MTEAITKKIVAVCLLLFLMNLSFPSHAFAYLDPGTGSYVFQLLIATLLGLAFVLKVSWGRIKGFLAVLFSKGGEQTKGNENGEPEG